MANCYILHPQFDAVQRDPMTPSRCYRHFFRAMITHAMSITIENVMEQYTIKMVLSPKKKCHGILYG